MTSHRWVDIVTTIPPFINEITARKNAESPFLRLPLELKTRIYEFVCGGQIVHMNTAQRGGGLSHRLCHEELSEEEAQKKFDTSEAVWYVPETADRHTECCARRDPIAFGPAFMNSYKLPPNEMLETNILYCCRQVYLESQFVPYYANTFSFYSAGLLRQFCCQIPWRYKKVIRSLHMELKISVRGNEDTEDWNRAFRTMTNSLKYLQRLHISMELVSSVVWYCHADRVPAEKSMLSHILQAGKLDLNVVTVVLWDSHFRDEWSRMQWFEDVENEYERLERWTLAQKQEWSRYVRNALLHYEDRDLDLERLKREALEEGRVCRL